MPLVETQYAYFRGGTFNEIAGDQTNIAGDQINIAGDESGHDQFAFISGFQTTDRSIIAKIERWLSPPDSTKNYQEALQNRQEGTCSWFLDGKWFTEWQARPDVLLWIKGIGSVLQLCFAPLCSQHSITV